MVVVVNPAVGGAFIAETFEERTTASTLAEADNRKTISVTVASNHALPLATTLPSGWTATILNTSTATISVTPTNPSMINGRSFLRLNPGETAKIYVMGVDAARTYRALVTESEYVADQLLTSLVPGTKGQFARYITSTEVVPFSFNVATSYPTAINQVISGGLLSTFGAPRTTVTVPATGRTYFAYGTAAVARHDLATGSYAESSSGIFPITAFDTDGQTPFRFSPTLFSNNSIALGYLNSSVVPNTPCHGVGTDVYSFYAVQVENVTANSITCTITNSDKSYVFYTPSAGGSGIKYAVYNQANDVVTAPATLSGISENAYDLECCTLSNGNIALLYYGLVSDTRRFCIINPSTMAIIAGPTTVSATAANTDFGNYASIVASPQGRFFIVWQKTVTDMRIKGYNNDGSVYTTGYPDGLSFVTAATNYRLGAVTYSNRAVGGAPGSIYVSRVNTSANVAQVCILLDSTTVNYYSEMNGDVTSSTPTCSYFGLHTTGDWVVGISAPGGANTSRQSFRSGAAWSMAGVYNDTVAAGSQARIITAGLTTVGGAYSSANSGSFDFSTRAIPGRTGTVYGYMALFSK